MIPPKISSEPRLLRWGVLGAARINAKAVPALQGAARSKVLALASRNEGRARLQAGVLGVPQAFGDYEALLEDRTLDAIYISVPTEHHVHWARRALSSGKHVLVEKPLTLISTWDGDDLPDGTYYYILDLKNGDKEYTGYVTIMR